jgi:two-component system response regulator AtoC
MIKKVLIVDDDQEMLLSLKEGFEKYNATFSVLMAGDGLVATEKLEKETISLVITDLRMPRMDGFALLSKIMEQYPDIPVIIITGYSTPERVGGWDFTQCFIRHVLTTDRNGTEDLHHPVA